MTYPAFSSWDKIEIEASSTGELSLESLVQHLRNHFGVETSYLSIPGADKQKPFVQLYSKADALKMNWTINLADGKLELSTEEILKFWFVVTPYFFAVSVLIYLATSISISGHN